MSHDIMMACKNPWSEGVKGAKNGRELEVRKRDMKRRLYGVQSKVRAEQEWIKRQDREPQGLQGLGFRSQKAGRP